MPLRDLAAGAFGWALAIAVWAGASRVPRSLLSDEVGAAGFPQGLAALLAAVSTLIVVRALWAWRRAPAPEASAPAEPWTQHVRALGIVGLGFGYLMLAPWTGYAPAVALLIFATAVYYGARPTARLAVIALAGAGVFWLVFARLLGVSMPVASWSWLFG